MQCEVYNSKGEYETKDNGQSDCSGVCFFDFKPHVHDLGFQFSFHVHGKPIILCENSYINLNNGQKCSWVLDIIRCYIECGGFWRLFGVELTKWSGLFGCLYKPHHGKP